MTKRKRADPLRQENYGLPIGQILEKPYQKRFYSGPRRFVQYTRNGSESFEYEYEYEFVNSCGENVNSNLRLRRGDIAYVKPSTSAPKFMYNEYVVIIDRYKITKHKYKDFNDYGAVLMVITGPNKGRVGRAYGCLGSILNKMTNYLEEI